MIDAPSHTRREAASLAGELQRLICEGVAEVEASAAAGGLTAAAFAQDDWSSGGAHGAIAGRGSTRTIANGAAFEKGGVNTSIVTGRRLPPSVVAQRPELEGHGFFAAGVSVVLHPRNPHAPTAHCNFRYFESQTPGGETGAWWFGGGADLTPYYPVLDDVRHFHATLKAACDKHDGSFYPAFKAWCDRYFYLPHRGETRGVGGIFFDYLDADGYGEAHGRTLFAAPRRFDELLAFMGEAGRAFAGAYLPLVRTHALDDYGERERSFQLLRRGRYVEFNLLYDRGTTFGLQSGGRPESILMSLPPLVRWGYNEVPEAGTAEAELLTYLQPRDWLSHEPAAGTT